MPNPRRSLVPSVAGLFLVAGCGGALYPPRPPSTSGPPLSDPPPSKVVVHATVSTTGMKTALEQVMPAFGEGTFELSGTRKYSWRRKPLELRTANGKIDARASILATVELPLAGAQSFPLDVRVAAEPVLTADYQARLQGTVVEVTSTDGRLKLAQGLAGILDTLQRELLAKVEAFSFDLRPQLAEAHGRIARPIALPLGDAKGCAELRVVGVEAGPTVLADGVEKDFALVVTPSVTLPCAAPETLPALPPLANVAALPSGPFTVTVPIAARYEELQRAMSLAFTDGKLHFSKEFPELYMSEPEVYAGADQLVLKLHIAGPISKGPIHTTLNGDIFFAGHPQVVDNELRVPDLQPTIETSNFLLKLKAALDGESIRTQARDALRLDLGERLSSVRAKLSTELAFGSGAGCMRADVMRIEVTGIHPHLGFLRVYVKLTAQASVYVPCPVTAPAAPATAKQ